MARQPMPSMRVSLISISRPHARVMQSLRLLPAYPMTTGAGVLSLTAGYSVPLTASTTDWQTAFGWGNHASQNYFDKDVDDTGDLTESGNLFYTRHGSSLTLIPSPRAISSRPRQRTIGRRSRPHGRLTTSQIIKLMICQMSLPFLRPLVIFSPGTARLGLM